MKKIIFAISGLLLLSFGSCQKEEIKPNHNHEEAERNIINDDFGCNKSSGNYDLTGTDIASDTLGNITDPNRDEDDERRVKRK
jgi:hypothetical protein